jgi:uncharacterized protein (TIGR02588 family)
MADETDEKSGTGPKRYPLLEWISAAIGLAIAAVMFGLLTYEAAVQRPGVPPLIKVEPTALVKAGNQYVLELEVRNVARRTASTVQVEGVLKKGGQPIETSSASIDYVPGESRRNAALIFTTDPRQYPLTLRVTGFSRP